MTTKRNPRDVEPPTDEEVKSVYRALVQLAAQLGYLEEDDHQAQQVRRLTLRERKEVPSHRTCSPAVRIEEDG